MGKRRGRPPKGIDHVDSLPGDPAEKDRLKVILLTITGALPVQEACALQDLQMLGHRIERHFYWCRQFADGGRSGAQSPHQKATSGIAESSENTVQVRCILFNHMVEYKPTDLNPQLEFEIVAR